MNTWRGPVAILWFVCATLILSQNGCVDAANRILPKRSSAIVESDEPMEFEVTKLPEKNLELHSNQDSKLDLRVVSYNVHLLPKVARPFAGERSATEYRAIQIAEELAEFELLGLCEAFDEKSRLAMIQRLQERSPEELHFALGPKRSGRHLIGGGLLLLSKFPIVDQNVLTYRSATRVTTHGMKSDGFAAKGALHVRLEMDIVDTQLDCFLTHLDSQSSEVRTKQVTELCAFVSKHHDAEVPLIVMGDFNIEAPSGAGADGLAVHEQSEYQELLGNLNSIDRGDFLDLGHQIAVGPRGSSNATEPDGGRRIDYVFISDSTPTSLSKLIGKQAKHLPLLDKDVAEGSLSDHAAVACELQLTSSRIPSRIHK